MIRAEVGRAMQAEMQMLAREIYDWCKAKDLWGDNIIYFNGKAWSAHDIWTGEKGKQIAEDLYEYENKNPLDYFEYANPKTLSMSFEGPLNHVLNGYVPNWSELESEFLALFEKHDLYYEMGYHWSLAAYKL